MRTNSEYRHGTALNLFLFLTYCNVEIVAFSGAESGCIGNRYFLDSGANLPQPQIAAGILSVSQLIFEYRYFSKEQCSRPPDLVDP